MTGLEDTSLTVFEPHHCLLGVKGLSMAEAATEPNVDNCMTLIMQNDALSPRLNKGQVLGIVYPASLLSNAEQRSCNNEEHGLFVPTLNHSVAAIFCTIRSRA